MTHNLTPPRMTLPDLLAGVVESKGASTSTHTGAEPRLRRSQTLGSAARAACSPLAGGSPPAPCLARRARPTLQAARSGRTQVPPPHPAPPARPSPLLTPWPARAYPPRGRREFYTRAGHAFLSRMTP